MRWHPQPTFASPCSLSLGDEMISRVTVFDTANFLLHCFRGLYQKCPALDRVTGRRHADELLKKEHSARVALKPDVAIWVTSWDPMFWFRFGPFVVTGAKADWRVKIIPIGS